ncbi:MAG: hypothetical protein JSW28_08620, partial [Thermoplasmata archaeon]
MAIALLLVANMFTGMVFAPAPPKQSEPAEVTDDPPEEPPQQGTPEVPDESCEPSTPASDNQYIRVTMNIDPPTMEVDGDGRTRFILEGGFPDMERGGEPAISWMRVQLLIPYRHQVDDVRVYSREQLLEGTYDIPPTQPPVSLDVAFEGDFEPVEPDPAVYASADPYPGEIYEVDGMQWACGYGTVTINLYPIQYVPQTGRVTLHSEIDIQVRCTPAEFTHPFRGLVSDRAFVEDEVINPETFETYPQPMAHGIGVIEEPQYDYVIITTEAFVSAFQPLVDYKNTRVQEGVDTSINATIKTVESITSDPAYWNVSNPVFNDTQAQIRSFIKDAYYNWATQYVVLGAHHPMVPARELHYGTDTDIPSDSYYGCLDGNMNADGDEYFGEYEDDMDMEYDILVGRLPVKTTTDIQNYINKLIFYEQAPHESPWLKRTMLTGKAIYGQTYGGDFCDYMEDTYYPENYARAKYYQRDLMWDTGDHKATIDLGIHFMTYFDHGSPNYPHTWQWVDTLENEEPFIYYNWGCSTMPIDSQSEVAGVHYLNRQYGAVANMGHSRTAYTGSNHMAYRFYECIFNEGRTTLGEAFAEARESHNRMHFMLLNLFGDPEIDIRAGEDDVNITMDVVDREAPDAQPPKFSGLVDVNITANEPLIDLDLTLTRPDGVEMDVPVSGGGTDWTATLDLEEIPGLGDGIYWFLEAVGTTAAGGTGSASREMILDFDPPTLYTDIARDPGNGDVFVTVRTFQDNLHPQQGSEDMYHCSAVVTLPDLSTDAFDLTLTGGTKFYYNLMAHAEYHPPVEGTYGLHIDASDLAGNVGTWDGTFTVDRTATAPPVSYSVDPVTGLLELEVRGDPDARDSLGEVMISEREQFKILNVLVDLEGHFHIFTRNQSDALFWTEADQAMNMIREQVMPFGGGHNEIGFATDKQDNFHILDGQDIYKYDSEGVLLLQETFTGYPISEGQITADDMDNIHMLLEMEGGGNSLYYAKVNREYEFLISPIELETVQVIDTPPKLHVDMHGNGYVVFREYINRTHGALHFHRVAPDGAHTSTMHNLTNFYQFFSSDFKLDSYIRGDQVIDVLQVELPMDSDDMDNKTYGNLIRLDCLGRWGPVGGIISNQQVFDVALGHLLGDNYR